MCVCVHVSLVTGSMSLTAAQRDSHHTAGKGHVQSVCVSVQVEGEDTPVVLTVRQTPEERDRETEMDYSLVLLSGECEFES